VHQGRRVSLLPWVALLVTLFSTILFPKQIDFGRAHEDLKMTAVKTTSEIVIDGKLVEPDWQLAEPVSDFIQRIPLTGQPATERTEVRLLYDDDNLYVGVHCFDSKGPEGIVVNEITKDFYTLDSDGFQIVLDTYDDNRNAFLFGTNPEAGRFDMQIGSDGNAGNMNWDGIWFVDTTIDEEGWHVEIAIPFKTLRFHKVENQIWGVNFERRVRRKFEDSYWAPIIPPYRLGRVSIAGSLEGLQDLQQGRNLYVKPYLKGALTRFEDDDVDFLPDAGLDVKYGVTSQLTLDLTANTDFSEVEADAQQINLTRFNLFFPEKRDFFLENASLFAWGRSQRSLRFVPDLIPFFSRRIGLDELDDENTIIPILGGARLTGRAGQYTMGLLTMQTSELGDLPSTNYTVARVRRDLLRQSDIGGIFVAKNETGDYFNRTYGADANFTFFNYLNLNSYILRTDTPDLVGENLAGNVQAEWIDRFWEIRAGHLVIQDNFNPEVGFVRRDNIRKSSGLFGITPRPEGRIPWVREFNPHIEADYITNTVGELETRRLEPRLFVVFNNSSVFSFGRESFFERLDEDFEIQDDIIIETGDYGFDQNSLFYRSDRSKLVSGMAFYRWGGFWNGEIDRYGVELAFKPSYRFTAEVEWRRNDVTLPQGAFTTDLFSTTLNYSFSNQMFLNGLIQYNSDNEELSSNIRFNFIHRPLSDLFVVYNERRSTAGEGVLDRAIIVKFTYLFAF
jgi:hypothetical protein